MMLLVATFGFAQQVVQDFEDGGIGEKFGNSSAEITDDPETGGTKGKVAMLTSNPAGTVWQGVNINFITANKVDLTSDKTMSMDVYSTSAITIAPKVSAGDNGAPASTTSASHTGNGWETLTFTFNEGLDNTTTANGIYGAFVIYYNWDTDSNDFGTQDSRVFYVDNITGIAVVDTCINGIKDGDETDVDCGGSCGPCAGTELVTNGDFETGTSTPWTGNAVNPQLQGSNYVNQADVEAPGPNGAFDVNISQEIDLRSGKTYLLTFDAFTDASTGTRSMIAGLGQTGAPFDSVTFLPELTSTPQTFSRQLTIGYGDDVTDRVFFDMAAEVGFVFIDNVSVIEVQSTCNNGTQDGDETGVDCGGSCAPCIRL